MNFFLFYIREDDGSTRRGSRRGMRRGRRGTRKRKQKKTEKKMKKNKKKISEEDCQIKGMSLVALLKTRLSHLLIIHFLFTDG